MTPPRLETRGREGGQPHTNTTNKHSTGHQTFVHVFVRSCLCSATLKTQNTTNTSNIRSCFQRQNTYNIQHTTDEPQTETTTFVQENEAARQQHQHHKQRQNTTHHHNNTSNSTETHTFYLYTSNALDHLRRVDLCRTLITQKSTKKIYPHQNNSHNNEI